MARQADLLSVEEARSRILDRFRPTEPETVGIDEALGRVLTRDVASPATVPPFANSSMDGFALRAADTTRAGSSDPVRLEIVAHIAAGTAPDGAVAAGQCARIMTGAPMPSGADSVIPFEEVRDTGRTIEVSTPVKPGACVRPAGNDLRQGQQVLRAGTELGAPQIGLLAAVGIAAVDVHRRPVVAVVATGDELVPPGRALGPGQIFNSNSPMLAAAVVEAGGRPRVGAAAPDDPDAIASALLAARDADLLLTSGGASVGDFDHVKEVVGAAGEVGFWRVRVRPGKPLLFGDIGGIPILGLPGNPTSAMVTFEQFVRPAIRAMLGAAPFRPEVEAVLDDRIDNSGGRRTYARVKLRTADGTFHASLAGPQDSAMLLPLAHADGLLEVPEDCSELLPGSVARVQVWRLPSRE